MKNKLLLSCLFLLASMEAHAQPGSLDLSFNPGDVGFGNGGGATAPVYAVGIQSDEKIVIGGSFSQCNETIRNNIARLDASINPGIGASDEVLGVALQPDGKILIGVVFDNCCMSPRAFVGVPPSYYPRESTERLLRTLDMLQRLGQQQCQSAVIIKFDNV